MSGIDTVITNHFKMLFGDMADKSFDEIHNREFFNNKFVVFVTVVFKGDKITVIINNAGGGDNRSAKVSTYVFQNLFRFAFVGFGVNIESCSLVVPSVLRAFLIAGPNGLKPKSKSLFCLSISSPSIL